MVITRSRSSKSNGTLRKLDPKSKTAIPDEMPDDKNPFAKPNLIQSWWIWRWLRGVYYNHPPSDFPNWGGVPGFLSILKWRLFEKDMSSVPRDEKVLDETIPVTPLSKLEFENVGESSSFYATWLGHATVLVHMDGFNFITDPIWADRASLFPFAGPIRYRKPPMAIEDLPKGEERGGHFFETSSLLRFGVISHDHYDHLDLDAVKKITALNEHMQWFVPMGMKSYLMDRGIPEDALVEKSWGQSDDSVMLRSSSSDKQFKIHCVPAQHWCQRFIFDRNNRLWCGWVVEGPSGRKFYYSGDTGNCDSEFKKMGDHFGGFDLSAIPIGAYAPKWFMKSQHICPKEAFDLHELVKSKCSIGIHWGTYHMGSYEHYLEPKEKLQEFMKNKPAANPFITINMGDILDVEKVKELTSEQSTNSPSW